MKSSIHVRSFDLLSFRESLQIFLFHFIFLIFFCLLDVDIETSTLDNLQLDDDEKLIME